MQHSTGSGSTGSGSTDADEHLGVSGARLSEIAGSIPGVVFQVRVAPDGSMSVPFISQQAEEHLGVSSEAIMADAQRMFDPLDAEERAEVLQAISESTRLLKPYSRVSPMNVGGERRWHHIKGSPRRLADGSVHWTGVAMDVTPLKRAEAALSDSERKYRLLVDSIPDAVFVIDAQLRHVVANEATARMSGLSREQILSMRAPQILPDEQSAPLLELLQRVTTTNQPETLTEQLTMPDGVVRWIQLRACSIPEGVLCFMRDVTEQTVMAERVEWAHRMEAIGTLAGGLAHEFNNLLMGIEGRVSLLLLDVADQSIRTDLEVIEKIVHRAGDLTRQLLGFARRGKYEPVPVDVNALLERTIAMFSSGRAQQPISLRMGASLWQVEVDRPQFEQVLLSLLDNARAATSQGGSIEVHTQNVELRAELTRPFDVEPGRFVHIAVRDTGEGMSQETLQRIFEPFFTTREMGHGAGLGLAASYGIVRNHGGILAAESELAQGTVINIYLPASETWTSSSGEDVAHPVEREAVPPGETVLLVDDEQIVRDVGARMLERLGFRVLVAGSGAEAARTLQDEKVSLVVLDMILPGEKPEEIVREINAFAPRAKILLCSGYSITGQAEELLAGGCHGFLQKPYSLALLSAKLDEVLHRPPR